MSVGSCGRPIPHLSAQLPSSGCPVHPKLPEAPRAWNLEAAGSACLSMGSVVWALQFAKDVFDKKDLAQTSPGPGPKAHAEWISRDVPGLQRNTPSPRSVNA